MSLPKKLLKKAVAEKEKLTYQLFLKRSLESVSGLGLEIGPGENPILNENHYHLDLYSDPVPSQFFMKSEAGEIPIGDAFFDFIVNAHILEHSPNPIRLIREWKRVTKPGGTIFFIMPHGERTFDSGRELVDYTHLLEDYRQNTDIYDMTHAVDFLEISAKQYSHKCCQT